VSSNVLEYFDDRMAIRVVYPDGFTINLLHQAKKRVDLVALICGLGWPGESKEVN
jgi:hypothetical protein